MVGHDSFRARGLKRFHPRHETANPSSRARFISCSRIETLGILQHLFNIGVGHDSFRARGLKPAVAGVIPTGTPVGHDSFRARGLKQVMLAGPGAAFTTSGTIHFVLED